MTPILYPFAWLLALIGAYIGIYRFLADMPLFTLGCFFMVGLAAIVAVVDYVTGKMVDRIPAVPGGGVD